MEDRNAHILQAAQGIFARYGYGKTTMGDIAREAGVARQTVYNSFGTKEEVLREALRLYADANLAEVQQAWDGAADLAERIDILFELGPLAWFRAIQSMPDMAEMLDGLNAVTKEVQAEIAGKWVAALESRLSQDGIAPADGALTTRDLAEFLYHSAKNAKYGLTSVDQLEQRLRTIKAAALAMV